MTDYKPLMELYNRLTDNTLILNMGRIFMWENWCSHGWTTAELELTIRFLQKQVRDGKKWSSCLLFTKLIRETDDFEEYLGMAKAAKRKPSHNPAKASVLRSSGRSGEPKPKDAVKSAEAVKNALAAFKKMRDSL